MALIYYYIFVLKTAAFVCGLVIGGSASTNAFHARSSSPPALSPFITDNKNNYNGGGYRADLVNLSYDDKPGKLQIRAEDAQNIPQLEPLAKTRAVYLPNISHTDVNSLLTKSAKAVQMFLLEDEPNFHAESSSMNIDRVKDKTVSASQPTSSPDNSNQIAPPANNNNNNKLLKLSNMYFMQSERPNDSVKNISTSALIIEGASQQISKAYQLNSEQSTYGLPTLDASASGVEAYCPAGLYGSTEPYGCLTTEFRSYSGRCNNVHVPSWGEALTGYSRLLSYAYDDGIKIPRGAGDDHLPSARLVSVVIHKDVPRYHEHVTQMLTYWAQFIDNDMSFFAINAGYHGSTLNCCHGGGGSSSGGNHPECFPIDVSPKDPFFAAYHVTCLNYVRSATVPKLGCSLGPRDQINQASAYLDASTIYGSSPEENARLRMFKGGMLKVTDKGLLPPRTVDGEAFRRPSEDKTRKCFISGDTRVNLYTPLTVIHTLFVREHNRIATKLYKLNAHWNDERLFQEARKIVIAEIQHITFNEFLPLVLGDHTVDEYGLRPLMNGFYHGYSPRISAATFNSFAAAAIKFWHSTVDASVYYVQEGSGEDQENGQYSRLEHEYFQPQRLYEHNAYENYIRGLLRQPSRYQDEFITEELTNRWLADSKHTPGLDIVAFAIQRGRDHGLPSYNKWRAACGLRPAHGFEDLSDVIPIESLEKFKQVYNQADDIDLYSGGMAEIPIKGGLVGPTFACIIARQFYNTRRGDRFWYENDLPPSSFDLGQLNEIRKVTLASIICDNSHIKHLQPHVFLLPDKLLNAPISCRHHNYHLADVASIPRIDLHRWQTKLQPKVVVPDKVLQKAIEQARKDIMRIVNAEEAKSKNTSVDDKSSESLHGAFLRPESRTKDVSIESCVFLAATFNILDALSQGEGGKEGGMSSYSTDTTDIVNELAYVDVEQFTKIAPLDPSCEQNILPCDHTARFRTLSGWCNNLKNPAFGSAERLFNRLLKPAYDDYLNSPRWRGVDGGPLPGPRVVSLAVHPDVYRPHKRYQNMIMQYGQFVSHDINFTPAAAAILGTPLDCGSCDSNIKVSDNCLPIVIPSYDPHFEPVNKTTGVRRCLPFARSLSGRLTLGPREQINQITSYIDLSQNYGSSLCNADTFRTFKGGRLNVTQSEQDFRELLPQAGGNDSEAKSCRSKLHPCFKTGDRRSNENPALTTLHIVTWREHNALADELAHLNSHWDDERLYQEARRISIAQYQHITYREMIPRYLGRPTTSYFNLDLLLTGYYDGYDAKCDAAMLNDFSAAAYRLHTLVRGKLSRVDESLDPHKIRPLILVSNNPDILFEGPGSGVDLLLRGMAVDPSENYDNYMTNRLTDHLFEQPGKPQSGLDLAAFNIQRGRDHGLNPYNRYRQLCNLTVARSFDDLAHEMMPETIKALASVYKHVDDIDLFTGAICEKHVYGGMVGPTAACIMGEQFRRSRKCDRYWYETSNPLIRFTEGQLNEIRKTTLARIICRNSDSIDRIQREVMDEVDEFINPLVHCDALPKLDLRLWKENYACKISGLTLFPGESERISPCTMCVCTLEGPYCQSMRVRSCAGLLRRFTVEQVAKDTVCSVQCPKSLRVTYEHAETAQKKQSNGEDENEHHEDSFPEDSQRQPTSDRKRQVEQPSEQNHEVEDNTAGQKEADVQAQQKPQYGEDMRVEIRPQEQQPPSEQPQEAYGSNTNDNNITPLGLANRFL